MENLNMSNLQMSEAMTKNSLDLEFGNAICYSGYREGQSPRDGMYPSYAEVSEDLHLLEGNWKFLRLYDCSRHAEIVLDVIGKEKLDFKIMLGADMGSEVNNPGCPWAGELDEHVLAVNQQANSDEIDRLIALANLHPEIIFSVSVGNEASVEWTDHMVPVDSLISYVRRIKAAIAQPVTFCENYVPWTGKLQALVEELDFISLHTYPVWEYQSVESALDYTKQNYYSVADFYPDKPVVITEAGWTTTANGRGIEPWNASQELQAIYYDQLIQWTQEEKILTFVFEAFDEPWKGSEDPNEPEKHWGIFTIDRQPKLVMQARSAEH
ncbi:MAG: exo-beta-1,3-glucanase (GH17 family) [Oleiphilaceae bacterium]|jgi:exo-beta-1,3-glucanase (GH17 family)